MRKRIKRLKLAYIAGFFDGEGSIGLYRYHSGKHSLRTQLVQNKSTNSTALFKELKERFGGCYSEQRSASGRTKYNWQLHGKHASKFLKKILPHLILKRQQASLVVAWQDSRPKASRNSFGHFVKFPRTAYDLRISQLLKTLKGK